MGLFDDIVGGLAAKDTQLVNQSGGVSGLATQFEQKGLGGVMSSWIGTGPNPPISGEQVLQVLGHDKIVAMAAKAGLSEQEVTDGISKLLPVVVDHLTPNGTVPPHSPTDVNAALDVLKQKVLGS